MNYPVDESMDYEARHREMDRTSSAATSGRRTSSQGSVLQSGVSVAARECLERPDSDFEVSDTRNIGIFRILSIGNFEILISGLQSSESFGIRCSGDLEVRISKTLILRILKLPNFVYLGLISSNLELQRSGLVPDALRITKNDRAKPGRREKFVFVFFNMKNKTH
ncbi:uncharacterized protein LOC112906606 [Agrilus planipennis]|uniref:Uncharacterized protein LOC112906606 n=1 Tax=Agrilus planipennis TaxID=224129 RepID=A0A7F5RLV4_AGRPL|nr:uncharacterized protein LOC112906606 [Agrilus planipennis]